MITSEIGLVLVVGLAAGTLSGVIGFGSSIIVMPFIVIAFGPQEAVPIMAIAAIMANLSRIVAWWREVDWRACMAYSVTGVPGAALGAVTLVSLPGRAVEFALGIFFIAMIPARRWLAAHSLRLRREHLAIVGAALGFLTGIVATTGPVNAPFFLAHGLVKGAYLSTEAASSLAVYLSKVMTFRTLGALPLDLTAKGLITGSSLMLGTFVAKRFVQKFEPEQFKLMIEGLMLASGAAMLWSATAAMWAA